MTMQLIEPCCAPKHLLQLREKLGESGTAFWHGYGDMSVLELLPALMRRYADVELLIALPFVPDQVYELIIRLMRRQCSTYDGKGRMDIVRHLTLITDLRESKSPLASELTENNPFPGRLTIRNVQQNDTVFILHDIAVIGNINLLYGGHFTAIATKSQAVIQSMREVFGKL